MKQKPFTQIILILFFVGVFFTQCKEEHECPECEICEEYPECEECEECPDSEECPEGPQYYTVFDSLQGVWSWYGGYDRGGQLEIDFETTIHIANINRDSAMYYETYKNDTLLKSGLLTVFPNYRPWAIKVEPNITLHFIKTFILHESYISFYGKDTIHFWDDTRTDMPVYFYKRIK